MKLRYLRAATAVLLSAGLVGSIGAVEVTVKNDSFVSGGNAVVVGGFGVGEEVGVRLQSPCNGTIVAVQIGWLDADPFLDPQSSLEEAIHIYADAGTFPIPGAELVSLVGPVLQPNALNEFRYIDEENVIPLSIPVSAGEHFFVTLEFANAPDIANGDASVFRDTNGCTGSANVLFAIPGGWKNMCQFITGDIVIRAVIDCPELEGACCFNDGTCDELTQSACQSAGGTYKGDLTTCAGQSCPVLLGACCHPDGSCDLRTAGSCATAGGSFKGAGTTCATANCPQPVGACCFEATGGCLNFTQAQCDGAHGVWGGPNTNCTTYNCFPTGACCLPDGTCLDGVTPGECGDQGGVFQGDGTTCATTNCPPPVGACCFDGGFCIDLSQDECGIAGGDWKGPGTACVDSDGGGQNDDCPGLLGDLNCDDTVDNFDIGPFVLAYTSPPGYQNSYPGCDRMLADCNEDGEVDAFDIGSFVQILVGGP